MRPVFSFLCVMLSLGVFGADKPDMPKDAKDTEGILEVAQLRRGYGRVTSKALEVDGRKLYAVWYCPFSGRDASYLYAYSFDVAQMRWVLFINKLVDHAHKLTAEVGEEAGTVVFKGPKGDVLVSESVAKLPKSN